MKGWNYSGCGQQEDTVKHCQQHHQLVEAIRQAFTAISENQGTVTDNPKKPNEATKGENG